MRDPSINLRFSTVVRLLAGVVEDPERVAMILLREGRAVACTNRTLSVTTTTKKALKKVNMAVDVADTELFNAILTMYRQNLKHRFIPLQKQDALWRRLGQVVEDANKFCEALEYDSKRHAYTDFIRIGIELMRDKYALQKFLGMRDTIVEIKNKEKTLADDDNFEATETFTLIYQEVIKSEYGTYAPVNSLHKKMELFKGRTDADSLGADYRTYIKAQVAGLEWSGEPIDTSNLYGDNAKERFRAYKKPEEEAKTSSYWEKIKKRNQEML